MVRASFIEIYNENIHDLLGEDPKKKLDLKRHPKTGAFVKERHLPNAGLTICRTCRCGLYLNWKTLMS